MSKEKIDRTMDKDLKRNHENDPIEIIVLDPYFKKTFLDTIERARTGDIKWYNYKEVF